MLSSRMLGKVLALGILCWPANGIKPMSKHERSKLEKDHKERVEAANRHFEPDMTDLAKVFDPKMMEAINLKELLKNETENNMHAVHRKHRHLSQRGEDPCLTNSRMLQNIAMMNFGASVNCIVAETMGWCVSSPHGPTVVGLLTNYCPTVCGICDDTAHGAITCTAQEITENKGHIAKFLNDFGACVGCAAPDEALATKVVKTPADPAVTKDATTSYATDDPKDPCRFPGIWCDRCGEPIGIMLGFGVQTSFNGPVGDSIFQFRKVQIMYISRPPTLMDTSVHLKADGWLNVPSVAMLVLLGAYHGEQPNLQNAVNLFFYANLENSVLGGAIEKSFGMTRLTLFNFGMNFFDHHLEGNIDATVCNSVGFPVPFGYGFRQFMVEVAPGASTSYTSIPACFKTHAKLENLQLANTNLEGDIDWLVGTDAQTALTSVRIGGNKFTGSLPSDLADKWPIVELVDISGSDVSGALPDLTNMSKLESLKMTDNELSSAGNLPQKADCGANGLVLDLAGNKLTAFPMEWQDLTGRPILSMDISRNELTSFPPFGVHERKVVNENSILFCGGAVQKLPPLPAVKWATMEVFKMNDMPNMNEEARTVLMALGFAARLSSVYLKNAGLHGDLPMEMGLLTPQIDVTTCATYSIKGGLGKLTLLDVSENQITAVRAPPYWNLASAIFAGNQLTFLHKSFLGELAITSLDIRNNDDLRIDVDEPAGGNCPAQAPGKLYVDQGSFTQLPSVEDHECAVSCKAGFITLHESELDVNSLCRCAAGYAGIGKTCTACAADQWSPGAVADCIACPAKSTSSAITTKVEDCKCDKGHYVVAPGTADQRCDGCPKNTFTAGVGMQSVADCASCMDGTYSGVGASECINCPNGSIGTGAGAGCKCDIGYYEDPVDATKCKACTGEHRTTKDTGSTSDQDCVCMVGYMETPQISDWQTRIQAGENLGLVSTCEPCPDGASCNTVGTVAANMFQSSGIRASAAGGSDSTAPQLMPGFWSSVEDPLKIYQCRTAEVCPGGAPETCGKGLEGALCELCPANSVWDGTECAKCNEFEQSPFIFPIIPVVLLFTVCLILYQGTRTPISRWDSPMACCLVALFIELNHFQAIVLINSTSIELPKSQESSYDMWSLTMDPVPVFRPGCAGNVSYSAKYIARMSLPLVLLAALGLLYVTTNLIGRMCLTPDADGSLDKYRVIMTSWRKTLSVFMNVIFGFFSGVVAMSLALFHCRGNPNPNPDKVLVQSMDIICFESDEWSQLLYVAIFGICVYCVGAGAVFGWATYVAPKRFPRSRDFQDSWKFLFNKYSPEAWWWGMVHISKVCLYNMCLAVFSISMDQLMAMQVITLAFSCAVFWYAPYRRRSLCLLEMFVQMSVAFAITCVLPFATGPDERSPKAVQVLAICGVMSPLVWLPLGGAALFHTKFSDRLNGMQEARFNEFLHMCQGISKLAEEKDTRDAAFADYKLLHQWAHFNINAVVNAVEPGLMHEFPKQRQLIPKMLKEPRASGLLFVNEVEDDGKKKADENARVEAAPEVPSPPAAMQQQQVPEEEVFAI